MMPRGRHPENVSPYTGLRITPPNPLGLAVLDAEVSPRTPLTYPLHTPAVATDCLVRAPPCITLAT